MGQLEKEKPANNRKSKKTLSAKDQKKRELNIQRRWYNIHVYIELEEKKETVGSHGLTDTQGPPAKRLGHA